MRQFTKLTAAVVVAATLALSFSSCKKEDDDEGKLPNIAFKTSAGYLAKDTTMGMNTGAITGITASKSEENDVLTKFTITRSFNSGADSVVFTENLSGAAGDSYSRDYPIITGNVAGKEKYTYTVVNRDGLINKVSLTVTVQ